MKPLLILVLFAGCSHPCVQAADSANATPAKVSAAVPAMHWAEDSSARPFSKDPSVIRFGGR